MPVWGSCFASGLVNTLAGPTGLPRKGPRTRIFLASQSSCSILFAAELPYFRGQLTADVVAAMDADRAAEKALKC